MRRLLLLALALGAACDCGSDAPARPGPDAAPSPDAARPDAHDAGDAADAGDGVDAAAPEEESRVRGGGRFFELPDGPRRRALATGAPATIEKGRGGRSLAFKITLDNGVTGYYKPEQTFSAAHWYAELASYHLDRQLGFGRTPPSIGRALPWEPLRAVAAGDSRIDEIIVQPDGTVRGAFIWWIPDRLVPLRLGRGWERWIRIDGGLALTPYQRPRGLREHADHARRAAEARSRGEEPPPPPSGDEDERDFGVAGDPDTPDRAAELSDMIVFDYLTTNVDRWGGNFTNVRTRGPGGALVFLDNGAGFLPGSRQRTPLMDRRIESCERFRRSTIDAVRAFDMARYRRRLASDPLAPLLNERQLDGLEQRRQHLVEHVDALRRRHGDGPVLPW